MKPEYKRVCPYCGEICEGYVGNNLICKCGAKYYYTTQTWLERKKEKKNPDLVEVVRCKDCKHFKDEGVNGQYCQYHTQNAGEYCDEACWVAKNDYCSYGERREE